MSKQKPPGWPTFWVLTAATAATVGGGTAALAVIWLSGRPEALLEHLRDRAGREEARSGKVHPGLIGPYAPSDFGTADGKGRGR